MSKKKIKVTDNTRLVMISIIALIFLGLAVIVNIRFRRISVTSMNNGHSADFHGRNVVDRLIPPSDEEIISIDNQGLVMITTLPSPTTYVNYSLMYKCEGGCPIIELDYLKKNGVWQKNLISHPAFEKIDWFRIAGDDGINLYQQELRYKNIEELLNNNEDYVVLEDVEEGEIFGDYLISRIIPPGLLGEWRLFNQVIAIKDAVVNKNGQTTLVLKTVGDGKVWVARINGALLE